jgi:Rieske Fe-S protein
MREKGLSMDRRDFLARLVKWFSSVFALLTLAAGISLWPAQTRRKDLRLVAVMDEDDIPKAGVRRIDFTVTVDEKAVANRVYLTVIDGMPTFFSPVCTHLGCYVTWDNNRKEFLCPCHGGKYNMRGEVTGGPPPEPLRRLPLEIRDGKVYVGISV